MIKVNLALCDHCGTCVAVCPMDCIELSENILEIDATRCNLCAVCVRVCPVGALTRMTIAVEKES